MGRGMTFREQIAEQIHDTMFVDRFSDMKPKSIERAMALNQVDAVLRLLDTCAVHIANASEGTIKHPGEIWKITKVLRQEPLTTTTGDD